ncbi:LURP-one-related/scramblase family protein [Periweissella fabalis]|uniref:Uncharacterized protein n=1 Tax=Periweissella fabalis TaxID=1070421 RepID=A0A7X6N4M6_9LACO|nr:hypothetical protein [Periweissella fabalis]MCM0598905.1 hypothetical protein [Periweissella fabalis]NKZ24567.1 hypothetical protein [Periweissella fabalis]
MRKLYLKQVSSRSSQTATTVRDTSGKAEYLVTGSFGREDAFIHVYNNLGHLIVELEQISFGLLPRFTIKFQDEVIGSIGVSLGTLLDVIYVRELNWFIRGSLTSGTYYAYHKQLRLMTVKPVKQPNGFYNELTITNKSQEPVLIGIAVILNRWLFNAKPSPLKNILRQPITLAYSGQIILKNH